MGQRNLCAPIRWPITVDFPAPRLLGCHCMGQGMNYCGYFRYSLLPGMEACVAFNGLLLVDGWDSGWVCF